MPPGYPGYSYLCPMGFTSLLTPWVAVIGSLAYALWTEAALLAIGTLWLRRRQALPCGSLFSIGIVAIAALVASIADDQIAQRDAITCHFGFYTHYDFKRVSEIISAQNMALDQANVALWIAAAAFLIGTFLPARLFILGWRGRRRATIAPSS
jgi:hypothetical protein